MLDDIRFEKRHIGKQYPAFIIAEAGVNHNGDIELAKQLVVAAKNAGADCVKFQTFTAEEVVTRKAPKAAYQLKVTDPAESQYAMLKKIELPLAAYPILLALCQELDILFLSTPYNFSDVDLLTSFGVGGYKLASIHCTELPMVEYVARQNKPVILSTGLATLADIVAASRAFELTGNQQLILLQCTTDYPAQPQEANLLVMDTIERATGAIVGYSDNSATINACVYAVAAGAKIIEKHFTLNKKLPGPDQAASADPEEFSEMVKKIREVEVLLGNSEKIITPLESRNATGMKRSLVARNPIAQGTVLAEEHLTFRRPATGLAPNFWYEILGKRAAIDIPADTPITREMIGW